MCGHKKTPVTILTGYLGSGKTTVLNELLKNEAAEKIAIKAHKGYRHKI